MTLIVMACLVACKRGRTTADPTVGDTLRLKYAEKLTIVKHDGFTEVMLADPWNKGKMLCRYLLVERGKRPPEQIEGTVVEVPLQHSVVATSVHCGLLLQLGRSEAIAGVCDLQYINLPWIQMECNRGRVADCGSGLQPTIEKIIEIEPDALFLSPFQNSGGYGKLETLKIPIIEMADYMESSALGRAEWMKFYGMLFGAEHEADSLFATVEKNYLALEKKVSDFKAQASDISHKASPKILMDKQTGGDL